jgi:hypothetical protein
MSMGIGSQGGPLLLLRNADYACRSDDHYHHNNYLPSLLGGAWQNFQNPT